MYNRIVRDYEVSIWTLQDSFITVLKPFGIELKGQINTPKLKIVDDGTLEFTFNLPMYYSYQGELIENPLWCNIINGVIVASMRKVKIIFAKHTEKQKVLEFLITKVIETHEKDEFRCEVTCEGLAFHELGKLGYKIALETDDAIEDSYQWFIGTKEYDETGKCIGVRGKDQKLYPEEEPRPTLQYWNDKVFKRSDGSWKWGWTYEIQMDYSHNPGLGREKDKIYEDEYISSWAYNEEHDAVEAQAYESDREKERTVDLKESNVYNLTQDLAKKFGVFCRYEYEHDDNFHIIGRKVVYYNNFIMEKLGPVDITYPYDASKISRTSDSTDMITKLYVRVEDNENEGEEITIINSAANKTREDYLLNFDYLNTVGAITPQQYEEVKQFEKEVYKINMKMTPLFNSQILLSEQLPELRAQATTLENSIALDQERRSATNDLLNALTNNTGIISITSDNPKMGIIVGDNPNYINFTELGIRYETLRIFKTYNTSSHVLTDEYRGTPQYDEFDNLVRVENLQHYQSYYYSPTSGVYSGNGEYGHLRSLAKNNDIESLEYTYKFLFDTKTYKDNFKRLNNYLLNGFQFSFNIDFNTNPSDDFEVKIYVLHYDQNGLKSGQQPIATQIFTPVEKYKRYVVSVEIPVTTELNDFRFTSNDGNNGIIVMAILTAPDGQLANTAVDNSNSSTNGIKASLSFGGRIEATEGNTSRTQSRVYLTYDYSPQLYYERVAEIWRNREVVDNRNLEDVQNKITSIEARLDECAKQIAECQFEKELLITRFEHLMGPALREGYWQPEEYKDYGDQYLETFKTTNPTIAYEYYANDGDIRYKVGYLDDADDTKVDLKYLYDSEPFEGEQVNYIKSFSEDNEEEYLYYPCIKLNNAGIIDFVKKHYNELSVSFCDVTRIDTKYRMNDVYRKIYHINSKCEYACMNINGVPTPVIMVTGARDDNLTDRQFAALIGRTYTKDDNIYDEFENADVRLTVIKPLETTISDSYKINKRDWFMPTNSKQMLYPRLQISSLGLRTDNDEINIKYDDNLLSNYSDYSLLIRDNSYYATFKPEIFAHYGWGLDGEIKFIISNANTAIYLDAIQVSKENSRPKVEYEVTVNKVKKDFINESYNYLGYIANINDLDLKFENVRGYISELELNLDKPSEDSIKIKNYKTKFEDLFSTIVAQTEQMQKNATTIAVAASTFTANGKLVPDVVEECIRHVDLAEAFSKGTLTWDEAEGMWAESDSGVVAIRGGGIFTATRKDAGGNWKWNTGITPEGINADLITAGQLDTNRIKVYAGDQLRFQLNADGLFAYKTIFDNPSPEYVLAQNYAQISQEIQDNHGIDYRQYVVHNGEGLFLVAKQGAPLILQNRGSEGYWIRRLTEDVNRVSISWDGLTLRNYANEKVFYADADTGDLTIAGTIYAKAGVFEGEVRAKSLFIGEDTTKNYIDDEGHLLPNIFGEDLAEGMVKAASLTVDSDSGKILLSSLQFDSLGAEASGFVMNPNKIEFFVESITPTEIEEGTTINQTRESAVLINTEGISIKAGRLKFISEDSGSGSGTSPVSFDNYISDINDLKDTIGEATDTGNTTLWGKINSQVSITPNDIWMSVTGWMNPVDPDSSIIQEGAYTGALKLTSDSVKLSATSDNVLSEFVVDISGLNLKYSQSNTTLANIVLDQNGIDVMGNIKVNGSDVWSKNSIIYEAAEDIDEFDHPDHDWVWIKPDQNAVRTITVKTDTYTVTTKNNTGIGLTKLNDNGQYFATSSASAQYSYSISFKAFTLDNAHSNVPVDITLTSGNLQVSTKITGVNFYKASNTVYKATISTNINLFPDAQSVITFIAKAGSSDITNIKYTDVTINCSTTATASTANYFACTIRYYP